MSEQRGGTVWEEFKVSGAQLVDTIKQSRHKNMKELIPPASDIRVLRSQRFSFSVDR